MAFIFSVFISILFLYKYVELEKAGRLQNTMDRWVAASGLISLLLFGFIASQFTDEFFRRVDDIFFNNTFEIWNSSAVYFFAFITSLTNTIIIGTIALIIILYFAIKKDWQNASLVFLSFSVGWILKNALKEIFQVARPDDSLILAEGFAFPSGHSLFAGILFALIVMYIWNSRQSNAAKIIVGFLAFIMMILIGWSRIYLHAHWFSDVLGGISLGIAIVAILHTLLRGHTTKNIKLNHDNNS